MSSAIDSIFGSLVLEDRASGVNFQVQWMEVQDVWGRPTDGTQFEQRYKGVWLGNVLHSSWWLLRDLDEVNFYIARTDGSSGLRPYAPTAHWAAIIERVEPAPAFRELFER
jgi:hypothetical protein